GPGTNYSSTDTPGVVGAVSYRLRVVFNDNTDSVLFSQSVTMPPVAPPAPSVSVTFNPFLSSVTPGFVHIEFTSITEVGVASYIIYRKDPGAANYVSIITVSPLGAGTTYANDDFAGAGNGTFLYKLTATFTDTTVPEKVLVTDQSITV
ncbi:MAG TPA: hypothetical protein VNZ45_12025, partial [Bacteroidia bacterium]|nr:hypothetical protein [Bacteroidia bacterium]